MLPGSKQIKIINSNTLLTKVASQTDKQDNLKVLDSKVLCSPPRLMQNQRDNENRIRFGSLIKSVDALEPADRSPKLLPLKSPVSRKVHSPPNDRSMNSDIDEMRSALGSWHQNRSKMRQKIPLQMKSFSINQQAIKPVMERGRVGNVIVEQTRKR